MADVIDWSLPCQSIFARRKPLVEATHRRIAEGIRRFVIGAAEPFIVPVRSHGGGGNDPRSIGLPLRTVTCTKRGEFALVAAFISKHYGGPNGHATPGQPMQLSLGTITQRDHNRLTTASFAPAGSGRAAEVRAFLIKYYGAQQGQEQQVSLPLHTVTAKARFGLVTVAGEDYEIADIGMRMLVPRELFAAQGFPDSYRIDPAVDGRPLTKTAQIRCAGNSVCPPVASAIVAANLLGAASQEAA